MREYIFGPALQLDSQEGGEHTITERAQLNSMANSGVSDLQPWSAFIFSACAVLVVATCYLAEKPLLEYFYGATYRGLIHGAVIDGNERRRRGFVYHHLALFFKLLLLFVCVGPFFRLVLPGPDNFRTPLSPKGGSIGGRITIGDVLLVAGQLYCAYYTWELSYRASLASYINILHHVVLLAVAQLGMALSAYPEVNHQATMEFYMCIVWGAFDVVSELPVHLAMILYRALHDRARTDGSGANCHRRRWVHRALFFCTVWCSCCTGVEMAVSAWLLRTSWDKWDTGFKIATPLILVVWGFAQCFSTWQICGLAAAERKKIYRVIPGG